MKLPVLTPLSLAHLAALASIALYLGAFRPACLPIVLPLFVAGLLVEGMPRRFKQPLMPAGLLLVILGLAAWVGPLFKNVDAFHGGAGLALAYLVLIPSRLGRLKWLLCLGVAELMLMGIAPGGGRFCLWVIPMALAALGLDGWLPGIIRVSDPPKPRLAPLFLRWVIAPVLLAGTVALLAGSWMVKTTASRHAREAALRKRQETMGPLVTGFGNPMGMGRDRSIKRDAQMVAQLTWESGALPGPMVYLRALALPDLIMAGPLVSWGPANPPALLPAPPQTYQPVRWAKLLRLPSATDVVLRVDGGQATELDALLADADGNLYRQYLHGEAVAYRVDFDDAELAAEPASLERCRAVDARLDAWPWSQIEDPHWRQAGPEHAAILIGQKLQALCHYDLENLPAPQPEAGGVLRGFLFGNSAVERVGHCQYFATAAVILLRRAGHTARCVIGYASDEVDGRSVSFRALHAHAWGEVLTEAGRWARFDPTPSAQRNTRITEGVDLKSQPPPAAPAAMPEKAPAAASASAGPWRIPAVRWWPALLLGITAALLMMRRNRPPQTVPDPRLVQLQSHHQSLIKVAQSLGLTVTPATTLSDVVADLEALTGVPLQSHLAAHLAARFGQGPLPEPWPIAELQAARPSR